MKKLWNLYYTFFKIGILTFGGGLAMLPMLKREIVNHYHWKTEDELLDIYAIGQCTPGVIAVNTSTYIGYEQAGIPGAIAGTLGVVSPSLLIIILVASVLRQFMSYPLVLHALSGVRIAVCAMMLCTVLTMARSSIKNGFGVLLFLLAFVLAVFTSFSTILIVLFGGILGLCYKFGREKRT